MKQSLLVSFLLGTIAVPVTGCGRDEIRVYAVAKEQNPRLLVAPLPPNWEIAPRGELRVASFRITGQEGKSAEVSVIPLSGQAGRDVDNVNRWRGQVGLPAVSEAELRGVIEPAEIAGQTGQLYSMTGENPGSGDKTSILAAILRRDGTAWFFKMTGSADIVAQQKGAFAAYLKSFQFPSVNAPTGSEQTELPPGHPGISAAAPTPVAFKSTTSRPTWAVPSGWRELDAGQFLVAKFLVPGPNTSQAVVNVSMSAGDGGGLSANVNRWRKQLTLGDLTDAEVNKTVKEVQVGQAKGRLVELVGTDAESRAETRIVAMIVPEKSQTWFYKLTGASPLVDREKESFIKFVQTSKYVE